MALLQKEKLAEEALRRPTAVPGARDVAAVLRTARWVA